MNTSECFALIETHFDHLFITDRANNAITLRPGFGNIPPFTLVCVEGGEFMMGENGIGEDENPPHRVSVWSFFMAEFPVTQQLYRSITQQSPSLLGGANHPVEQVSWYEIVVFCNQLNKLLKLPKLYTGESEETKCDFKNTAFRLPTEAEWEYAARGGKTAIEQFKYSGSDNPNVVAWNEKNNGYETKPVGLKIPNRLGIYDLSGNVWEWCWDCYDVSYYEKCNINRLTINPTGPDHGSFRVLRGGSWSYSEGYCRAASRNSRAPNRRGYASGFRILFAL
jgi:sulfatase modifying factor 1